MLGPAPPPEDPGGGAVGGDRPGDPGADGGGGGRRRPRGRLRQRRHRRADLLQGRVLLPGDEHSPAGRAPGHRGGVLGGPGRRAAPDSRGRASPDPSGAGCPAGSRHRVPDQRRGLRAELPSLTGAGHRVSRALRSRGPCRCRADRPGAGLAELRLPDRQADRLGPDPPARHRQDAPGAHRVRRHRHPDQHPVSPRDPRLTRLPARRVHHPLHRGPPRAGGSGHRVGGAAEAIRSPAPRPRAGRCDRRRDGGGGAPRRRLRTSRRPGRGPGRAGAARRYPRSPCPPRPRCRPGPRPRR